MTAQEELDLLAHGLRGGRGSKRMIARAACGVRSYPRQFRPFNRIAQFGPASGVVGSSPPRIRSALVSASP